MLLEWGYNIQLDSNEAGSKLFCGVQGACFGLCAVQFFGFGARLEGDALGFCLKSDVVAFSRPLIFLMRRHYAK